MRVLVGVSGGIDSFMTIVLLQEQGYEVIGICFDFWDENDLTIVEAMCQKLGITLIRRREDKIFKELIVDSFVNDYINARTPSPCCLCNSFVKWHLLNKVAKELNIEYIATGHYVKIKKHNKLYYIYRGEDPIKDQSYFLWDISQEILAKSITPLGDYKKSEVKEMASKRGYQDILSRRESMSICFLKGRDYREFVTEQSGVSNTTGFIYTRDGKLLGEHQGLLNYTIGQKRGIPTYNNTPMYVASMNIEDNTIIVDIKPNLHSLKFRLENYNIICKDDILADDISVMVRGLGLNPNGFAKITFLDDKNIEINLSEPAWALAPGQAVALYRKDRLIGGGYIQSNI